MNISQIGLELIKKFEGFSAVPYKCPAGKNTIGYGHTIESDPFIKKITQSAAEELLKHDLSRIFVFIKRVVEVPLSQGQSDALCSLIYNWGIGGFVRSKGLKHLNKKNYGLTGIEFFSKEAGVVNIKGKFSRGLYKRRQAELKLWNG
ncbi:MAG: lysozyme [Vicingaceae bacterium]|jgi:lysozyme